MGRATQGVRLINLERKNDEIASVCKVDTAPEETDELSVEHAFDVTPENSTNIENNVDDSQVNSENK
ncbi:MAG: hypothetical protein KBT10_04285, partial [Bacteroidales bacterium]|nr:hypothetical protein [Candidatus Sodaliphilus aphodohippi]